MATSQVFICGKIEKVKSSLLISNRNTAKSGIYAHFKFLFCINIVLGDSYNWNTESLYVSLSLIL